jgi:hypothetical protein
MKKIFQLFAVVAGFCFFLTSCTGLSKALVSPKMNTEIVPVDFNPKKQILLVLEMPKRNSTKRHKGITNKLDKIFKENYPYRYEIVSPEDIYGKNSKYADTSIYKYAVLNNLSSYQRTTTTNYTFRTSTGTMRSSTSPTATITSIDFRFYDRNAQKEYPLSGNSASFLKYTATSFIDIIIKAVEKNKAIAAKNKVAARTK